MLSSEPRQYSMTDKVSANYDVSCSPGSNGDSLLSGGNSPNITSPSSSSATISVTGYSVESDEGVDMTVTDYSVADMCKRSLFESSKKQLDCRKCSFEEGPLDLTVKKKTKHGRGNAVPKNVVVKQEMIDIEDRPLTIDEGDENENHGHNCAHQENKQRPFVNRESSPNLPRQIPTWPGVPRSVPEFSNNHQMWNPAFLMANSCMNYIAPHFLPVATPYYGLSGNPVLAAALSKLAKTNSPELQSVLGIVPPSTISKQYPNEASRAHTSTYDQNILSEFSRVCTTARSTYGRHVMPYTEEKNGQSFEKTDFVDKVSSTCFEDREVAAYSESNTRKRKICRSPVEDAKSTGSGSGRESLSPPNKQRHWEKGTTSPASAQNYPYRIDQPTMVPNSYVTKVETDDTIRPKTVDFKPYRFHCEECGRTYATAGGLKKHSETHKDPSNSKTFTCKTCEKEYTSLGALKMHIRTHTLPCKCHICGKAFSRTWLLQGHIRTHTGEKPYQCSVCMRAFADRSNLRAHMQTHETVKRYACTNCDKTFSRISLLNRHQASGCVVCPQPK